MDNFTLWLEEQKKSPNFRQFMGYIVEKRDFRLKNALAQGNTEFLKGEFNALNWVVSLPDELLEQLTATDTSEPLA